MLIYDINAPYLEDDRDFCDCPICRGTGYGLGEFTNNECPACEGTGIIETHELPYIERTYDCAEYWWALEN
jgi:RecJ-like exonuclease